MGLSSPYSKKFSERLREARELRQLSQGQLADRSGFQASAISHFETGTRMPSFANLRRLADTLNVTTDYLLCRVNDPSGYGQPNQLNRNIENLSAVDRKIAEDIIALLAKQSKIRRG